MAAHMAESSETHTFAFEAFPGRSLRVALFRDVENGRHVCLVSLCACPLLSHARRIAY